MAANKIQSRSALGVEIYCIISKMPEFDRYELEQKCIVWLDKFIFINKKDLRSFINANPPLEHARYLMWNSLATGLDCAIYDNPIDFVEKRLQENSDMYTKTGMPKKLVAFLSHTALILAKTASIAPLRTRR